MQKQLHDPSVLELPEQAQIDALVEQLLDALGATQAMRAA